MLAAVRNDWGSEAAFDAFVQTELVKVLEEIKLTLTLTLLPYPT